LRPRSAAAVVLLLVAGFAALLVWTMCARSAIPLALDGTVTAIDIRDEHPGHGNAWFVEVGGRTHHLDQALAEQLETGDRLLKRRWDRELIVGEERVGLRLSDDARAAFWFAPALVVAAVAVTAATFSRRRHP
jgi:hypothetical protein